MLHVNVLNHRTATGFTGQYRFFCNAWRCQHDVQMVPALIDCRFSQCEKTGKLTFLDMQH
jgi:hypothetical protein